MSAAIIINSRPNSNRVPGKPFLVFPLGKKKETTLIGALVQRCLKTGLRVILAVPTGCYKEYEFLKEFSDKVLIFEGSPNDPLKRMSDAATYYNIDTGIRVCHDKIFIEHQQINKALEIYDSLDVDYLYSSFFVEGSGFEIIRSSILHLASSIYKNVEHISYAIKSVTDKMHNWELDRSLRSEYRLLVDYPRDVDVMHFVFKRFKTKTVETPLRAVLEYLRIHPEVSSLNQPPILSVYTCCYNQEKFIDEAMESVATQYGFRNFEYHLIDDCSTDKSTWKMRDFAEGKKNIFYYRNENNLGLASSSNVALSRASGRYVMRLDADDYFTNKNALINMLKAIRSSYAEVIYPANYFGDMSDIQYSGGEIHHVGGAIFNRRSLNDIKFSDGLRGYEGLDFFERAKKKFSVGYLQTPIFFYRQHEESQTKKNLKEREKLRESILGS